MTQAFIHHIDKQRLSSSPSVKKAVNYLSRCGYNTTQMELDMSKFRKTRIFGQEWGKVTVQWVVEYVFEGKDRIQKVIDTPYIAKAKRPKEEKVDVVKDTRKVIRSGSEWYEVKTKYRQKFEESEFKDLYKSIDDFAKFATKEEVESL
jgi:hypothetical protein